MPDQHPHTATLPGSLIPADSKLADADATQSMSPTDQARPDAAQPPDLQRALADITAAVVAAVLTADCADIIGSHLTTDGNATRTTVYPPGSILGKLHTVASEDPVAAALSEHHPIRIDDMATERRWPEFAGEAHALGVGAMLSLPLLTGEGTVGVLTLYARAPGAFTNDDRTLAAVFTTAALRALEQREHLGSALESRDELEQATGLLMARNGITADQAAELLTDTAERSNTTPAALARSLLTDTARTTDPHPLPTNDARLSSPPRPPGAGVNLTCTRTDTRESAILEARGEIDLTSAPAFLAALDDVLRVGTGRDVVLDLSEVAFIDTVGLAALAALADRNHRGGNGPTVSVIGSRPVLRHMHALGLDRHLACHNNLDATGPFTPTDNDGVGQRQTRTTPMPSHTSVSLE